MDPLTALREYAIRGELDRIVRVGDDIRFGDEFSFPARSETAFRSKQGSFYTLDSLLFFLRHQHLKHTDYLQSSRLNRLPSVTFPDRVPLLDYLLGRSSSSDQIASPRSDPPEPAARLATPLPPPPIDYLSMIRALERPLKDRDALLECRSRDFHSLLLASSRREDDRSRSAPDRDPAPNSTPKPKMQKVGEGVPIILVPSAFQTLITIYNVKEFLEDGIFVPTESKVKGAAAKPECVTVRKKLSRDRAVAAYEVRDKAAALRKEDWERVVAVFVLGKEWQFKDWPFKDHVEIFNKIIGFYVRFEDDSLESAKLVKQWNVKIISISKNRRHQDRAAALEVWERLEAFMCSKSHT